METNIIEKEKTLIIGAGEVGTSLANALKDTYEVFVRDRSTLVKEKFKVIHICYPYSDKFIDITKSYIKEYQPRLVIVHSTVKPGTTRKLGYLAVHSPINGKHPNLEQSIRTFTKVIGGVNTFKVYEAVQFLNRANIRTMVFSSPEASELAKICCTTQYGWYIAVMKEIARVCNEYNVPFHEVYTEWNTMYNEGYGLMKDSKYFRPNLAPMDGGIGGHCVINNLELLDDFFTKFLKGRNEIYKES